ncbi:phage tail protein [Nonomuraea sp. NPDC052116]|uniref:phage tail protein n=1 Tax=Nonomuraea TaxID=83681 RepID=UPI0033DF7434
MPNGVPFTAFNYTVEITLPDSAEPLCQAAFAECSGLEMTAEVKTIRQGGQNGGPVHLVGPVSYSQLSLRRGMTESFDLWEWFERVLRDGQQHLRATCEVHLRTSDRRGDAAVFVLTGCLPTRLRAPALNAKDGQLAIEEMQIAYESMVLQRPRGGMSGA